MQSDASFLKMTPGTAPYAKAFLVFCTYILSHLDDRTAKYPTGKKIHWNLNFLLMENLLNSHVNSPYYKFFSNISMTFDISKVRSQILLTF